VLLFVYVLVTFASYDLKTIEAWHGLLSGENIDFEDYEMFHNFASLCFFGLKQQKNARRQVQSPRTSKNSN
jgi:hypothetical protein